MQKFIGATLLSTLALAAMANNITRDWGYYGEEGPIFWENLDQSYHMCGQGFHQSPIDLKDPIVATLPALDIRYAMTKAYADDAGYTLRIDIQGAGNELTLSGNVFKLNEMHFHQPAEHPVNGKIYPLEMHALYLHETGAVAALGVFIEEGAENQVLKTLLPALKTSHESNQVVEIAFNPEGMQPKSGTFYRYEGSLTTPPCREGLIWLIQQAPITASAEQIDVFKKLMPINARPVQPMHARMLLMTTGG